MKHAMGLNGTNSRVISQKLFNKKYCNVEMAQQWSLAKEYNVGMNGH